MTPKPLKTKAFASSSPRYHMCVGYGPHLRWRWLANPGHLTTQSDQANNKVFVCLSASFHYKIIVLLHTH
ncbi:uncharacterized protein MELLADRAFT_94633 [Melampsora larici-populina 98AG31]|uniref:Uncharacterized protein n=1 Tax=Melampsora larici-populina (strain 98AG31 / pathotype 3-4-7) TaxID=747676 RepID=F4S7E5_MELLP|nr:uncharacterized protein MELLADRAFT_94633 [Melampsora larici-populina 98AG31]EGF99438.1 hypothetical protein MELLADRAFT_94633 [Melampsora larici-populina 98AG31]